MKKIVVGFLGDKNVGKTTASNILVKEGYYKISICDKISEFAKKLFTEKELKDNKERIFQEIRQRGNKAHKGYWLNLVLISIPDDKDLIVIDDLESNDLIGNVVTRYQIYRPNVSTNKLPNTELIINDGNLNSFTEKILSLSQKLRSK